MLFPFAIADFALVGVILTLFRARILYSSIVVSLTLVAYVFFAALMFRNYFLSPLRKLRLEADRQTAEHFGKERLLQIFRKISDMRLGFQTGPRFLSDLTTPRIKERIRSLEGISNSVQPKENGMT
jgi:hypothetical protein